MLILKFLEAFCEYYVVYVELHKTVKRDLCNVTFFYDFL